ncbi:MAG: glycosyltransferase, partial [Nitriliruptorales bacterium]|nr:glycosyltransferase [Nitriliruptorales bacterium]
MTVEGLAFVVVTHDSCEDLLACLDTVTGDVSEIVVVDSGSRDDCLRRVGARHPGVEVLRLANVGFGQAANAGVARTTSDVIVVANAD